MSEPIQFDRHGNIILKVNVKAVVKSVVIVALAVGAGFLPIEGLTTASRISLMIFVGAAGLWITEAIPPFATAILVIVLNVFLLGRPGGPLGLQATGLETSYEMFLVPLASPVLVLFFGGLILAVAATKHGLDVRLAKAFIKPFGERPALVLLGVILTTAVFSMFMSNTATTAMMFAILMPVFSRFEDRGPFRHALALAVPFAANIGGMGTLIGTPPNAVAASVLAESLGRPISFLRWMAVSVPIVIVMLFVLWALLLKLFRPRRDRIEILFPEPLAPTWDLVIVVGTFSATVLLWLSEPLHAIPAAVVSLIPIMVFTMLGIIDRDDLKKIDWDVLILVAGGMTLGVGMKRSGLTDLLVGYLELLPLSPFALIVAVGLIAIIVSNFMSNTSAANLLIPLVISISGLNPMVAAFFLAYACSLAMSLPISTPPNALAYATRAVSTKEMALAGTLVSIIGFALISGVFYALSRLAPHLF